MFDNLKRMLGVGEEEEDYDETEEVDTFEQPAAGHNAVNFDEVAETSKRRSRVENINATVQLQVVMFKPERFDDACSIADHINARHTVVLNLEATNKEVSRRLVDFLSGTAYANQAQIKRVANCTFIITPDNVNWQGDILDELESNGFYF